MEITNIELCIMCTISFYIFPPTREVFPLYALEMFHFHFKSSFEKTREVFWWIIYMWTSKATFYYIRRMKFWNLTDVVPTNLISENVLQFLCVGIVNVLKSTWILLKITRFKMIKWKSNLLSFHIFENQ